MRKLKISKADIKRGTRHEMEHTKSKKIVGKGAGLRGTDRFGGAIIIDDVHKPDEATSWAIIIDDVHKPDEATSDVIREGVIYWFYNTLLSRRVAKKIAIDHEKEHPLYYDKKVGLPAFEKKLTKIEKHKRKGK